MAGRVTRYPREPLPEGWEWSDYSVPRAEHPATGARIEFIEERQPSYKMMRIGRTHITGEVPPVVRRTFARRNREIGPHQARPSDGA